MPVHGLGEKGTYMSEEEVTNPEVERRQGAIRRSYSDRRLWVRREFSDRRYGKGRRVWNRRVSASTVDVEARTDSRRAGVRRRFADERRDGPARREGPERRSADRRVA